MTLEEVEQTIGRGMGAPIERAVVWAAVAAMPQPEGATPADVRKVAQMAFQDALPSSPCPGGYLDPDWEYLSPAAAGALRRCCEWMRWFDEMSPTDEAAVIWGWREAVGSAWSVRAVEGDPMAAEVLASLWGWS
jgi:hypothetical protein